MLQRTAAEGSYETSSGYRTAPGSALVERSALSKMPEVDTAGQHWRFEVDRTAKSVKKLAQEAAVAERWLLNSKRRGIALDRVYYSWELFLRGTAGHSMLPEVVVVVASVQTGAVEESAFVPVDLGLEPELVVGLLTP